MSSRSASGFTPRWPTWTGPPSWTRATTPGPPATGLPGARSRPRISNTSGTCNGWPGRSTHLRRGQLIHGDLGGNVLFAHDRPPAIIDFASCWRPAAFAAAIVVADALIWEGAATSLIAAVRHIDDFPQYLLRALIYRAVTESILGATTDAAATAAGGYQDDRYLSAVDLACQLAAGSSCR
jgi:hypothetical protein